MDKVRIFETFAGYGSQSMALQRLKEAFPGFDYEITGWSEFDPDSKYEIDRQPAVIAHKALHPEAADRNYGDIRNIDWNDVPDFDLFTMSSPCFVAGTLIMTRNGFKNIEDISTDDFVLSHDKLYHKVCEVGRNPADCIVNVKGMGIDGIYCTPNHPFYVREMYRYGHKRIRAFRESKWKQAAELTKKDYLGIAINQENKLPEWGGITLRYGKYERHSDVLSTMLDKNEFWYVIGRYIGDGWTREDKRNKQVCICFSERSDNGLVEKVKNLGFNHTVTKERTTFRCVINSKELMAFVDRFGHYAYGKHIDGETFNLPVELLKSLLDGWVDSDGCYIEKTREYKITTISRELAYGLQQIVAKVYNAPARLYKVIRPKTTFIEGRKVNQRDFYQVIWHIDKRKQDHAFYEDGYIWYPCNGIEYTGKKELVYNMEVDGSHSYTANGTIVHNCQDFSNAGLQEGGEEGSGTRSSLLWECRKAIEIKRPKYILFENVKALVGKKFLPLFQKWIRELEGFGYTNSYMVMNARNYGVPQNRERVIMISILGNEKFAFPNPFPLGRFLSDIMEDNVDGKYYASKEKVDSFVSGKEEEIYRKAGFEVKDEIVKLGHMWKSLTNGLVYMPNGVSPTLLVGGNCHNDIFLVEGYKEGRKVFPCSFRTRSYCGQPQQLEINFKGSWSNTVTTIPKDYLMAEIFDEIKVRRATPRECFRLMGVKESDIDTIMSCGIAENFLYRLAGNSIVCGTGEKTCEELIDGSIVEHYDGILFNVLKKLLIDDKLNQKISDGSTQIRR